MGLLPLSGSIHNEGGIPDQVNGGGTPDHGAIPPHLVLSEMRVASRIMVPPLSGSILNEG